MTVKELIARLELFNQEAEVNIIEPNFGDYLKIIDVEEEYANLVTIGTEEIEL